MNNSSQVAFHDLQGIINLQEVSNLLTRIISQLNTQNKAIGAIEATLSTFVTQSALQDKVLSIERSIQKIYERLDILHHASTTRIKDKE